MEVISKILFSCAPVALALGLIDNNRYVDGAFAGLMENGVGYIALAIAFMVAAAAFQLIWVNGASD